MNRTARNAVAVGVALVNLALYWVGFLFAARVVYAGRVRPLLMALCFLPVGAVSRLWSTRWWAVIVPAAAGFVWGTAALKWAIYLTDNRGESAPPMTQLILGTSSVEILAALAAAVAAGLGWWLASWLRSRLGPVGPMAHPEARV